MKSLILVIACLIYVIPATAGQIKIIPGQKITVGDTTVTCTASSAAASPIELRECQHWDKFNQRCLYEKKTLVFNSTRCENSCQIWDDFNGVCLYEATCRFIPEQESFVRSTCSDFDKFNKVCRRTSDQLIR